MLIATYTFTTARLQSGKGANINQEEDYATELTNAEIGAIRDLVAAEWFFPDSKDASTVGDLELFLVHLRIGLAF
jgi:hypothetical protein